MLRRSDQTLAQVAKGKTALLTAHRLATIRRADLILVLEASRVVERRTHEELIATSTQYRTLNETR